MKDTFTDHASLHPGSVVCHACLFLFQNQTLGKETGEGWGAVLRWEVETHPEDWSVHGHAGRLMRAVPDPLGGTLYGIRPSYWSQRHQFRCKMPDTNMEPHA